MYNFQICLQNVRKAVWEYCCVRWQLVLKVKRQENGDETDQALRNQWRLSIPKKALWTKPRPPTTSYTGTNLTWGQVEILNTAECAPQGFFSSFLAFGGNVWWPLLWWPSYETRIKRRRRPARHSSRRGSSLCKILKLADSFSSRSLSRVLNGTKKKQKIPLKAPGSALYLWR